MKDKYERVQAALENGQQPSMKAFGRSMVPLIKSGAKLTYIPCCEPEVGDVVFAQVRGRVIAAHKVTRIDGNGRCMIANNRGRENGWASKIWGRVIAVNGEPFGRVVTGSVGQPVQEDT